MSNGITTAELKFLFTGYANLMEISRHGHKYEPIASLDTRKLEWLEYVNQQMKNPVNHVREWEYSESSSSVKVITNRGRVVRLSNLGANTPSEIVASASMLSSRHQR